MKEVLISVNKEHLDKILDGVKTIEWRKKPLPLGKHYGYETKNKGGCGKVTGEFEVVENIKFNLLGDTYKPQWLAKGCVPYDFLVKYANGKEYLYANVIENAKRYDKPKELGEFNHDTILHTRFNGHKELITIPPQSWCYVEV